jgi:hypothetical protein
MFHNHATPQSIYITSDKLCLNKLLHVSTQASGIKLLFPQQGGTSMTSASAPKLLQMLLAAYVPSWCSAS